MKKSQCAVLSFINNKPADSKISYSVKCDVKCVNFKDFDKYVLKNYFRNIVAVIFLKSLSLR